MEKSAIKARREQVAHYIIKGMSEDRMAELLGVHRNTIIKDVASIREQARDWLDGLARDGFIHEYRMAMQKIREHEFELQKLLAEANVAQKVQIIRALDENVRLYLELLGETPAVHAYRRALKRLQDRGNSWPVRTA